MRAYIAVTDNDWYRYIAAFPQLDEVNFWQPRGGRGFRVLEPGEVLLFKLHAPVGMIAGGGFFAHHTRLPVSLAWEAFAEKNGAGSLQEMRRRVERYRRTPPDPSEDYQIGCIVLAEPFFFPRDEWFPPPSRRSCSVPRSTRRTSSARRSSASRRLRTSRTPTS